MSSDSDSELPLPAPRDEGDESDDSSSGSSSSSVDTNEIPTPSEEHRTDFVEKAILDDIPYPVEQDIDLEVEMEIPLPPDSGKYSPSQAAGDDECLGISTSSELKKSGPSVLGKAQAKKRLLAFSAAKLAALPTSTVLTPKKIAPTKSSILQQKTSKQQEQQLAIETIKQEETKMKEILAMNSILNQKLKQVNAITHNIPTTPPATAIVKPTVATVVPANSLVIPTLESVVSAFDGRPSLSPDRSRKSTKNIRKHHSSSDSRSNSRSGGKSEKSRHRDRDKKKSRLSKSPDRGRRSTKTIRKHHSSSDSRSNSRSEKPRHRDQERDKRKSRKSASRSLERGKEKDKRSSRKNSRSPKLKDKDNRDKEAEKERSARERESEKERERSERKKDKEREERREEDRKQLEIAKELDKVRKNRMPIDWAEFRQCQYRNSDIRTVWLKLNPGKRTRSQSRSTSRSPSPIPEEVPHPTPLSKSSNHPLKTMGSIYIENRSGLKTYYPAFLVRKTKFQPSIFYGYSPLSSHGYYKTRDTILHEEDSVIVDAMNEIINWKHSSKDSPTKLEAREWFSPNPLAFCPSAGAKSILISHLYSDDEAEDSPAPIKNKIAAKQEKRNISPPKFESQEEDNDSMDSAPSPLLKRKYVAEETVISPVRHMKTASSSKSSSEESSDEESERKTKPKKLKKKKSSKSSKKDKSKSKHRDKSPSKSKNRDKSPPKTKHRDESPPKTKKRDESPKAKKRDDSPPKTKKRDQSPKARKRDESPPRTKKRDESPPKTKKRDTKSPTKTKSRDKSPPSSDDGKGGGSRSKVSSSTTKDLKSHHEQKETKPRRDKDREERSNKIDSVASPPRKRKHIEEESAPPPTRPKKKYASSSKSSSEESSDEESEHKSSSKRKKLKKKKSSKSSKKDKSKTKNRDKSPPSSDDDKGGRDGGGGSRSKGGSSSTKDSRSHHEQTENRSRGDKDKDRNRDKRSSNHGGRQRTKNGDEWEDGELETTPTGSEFDDGNEFAHINPPNPNNNSKLEEILASCRKNNIFSHSESEKTTHELLSMFDDDLLLQSVLQDQDISAEKLLLNISTSDVSDSEKTNKIAPVKSMVSWSDDSEEEALRNRNQNLQVDENLKVPVSVHVSKTDDVKILETPVSIDIPIPTLPTIIDDAEAVNMPVPIDILIPKAIAITDDAGQGYSSPKRLSLDERLQLEMGYNQELLSGLNSGDGEQDTTNWSDPSQTPVNTTIHHQGRVHSQIIQLGNTIQVVPAEVPFLPITIRSAFPNGNQYDVYGNPIYQPSYPPRRVVTIKVPVVPFTVPVMEPEIHATPTSKERRKRSSRSRDSKRKVEGSSKSVTDRLRRKKAAEAKIHKKSKHTKEHDGPSTEELELTLQKEPTTETSSHPINETSQTETAEESHTIKEELPLPSPQPLATQAGTDVCMKEEAVDVKHNADGDTSESKENVSPLVPLKKIEILPTPDRGILVLLGFRDRRAEERKKVKFADGVNPGCGTSSSGGEEMASPPPSYGLDPAIEAKMKKKLRRKKKKKKMLDDDLFALPACPEAPYGFCPPGILYQVCPQYAVLYAQAIAEKGLDIVFEPTTELPYNDVKPVIVPALQQEPLLSQPVMLNINNGNHSSSSVTLSLPYGTPMNIDFSRPPPSAIPGPDLSSFELQNNTVCYITPPYDVPTQQITHSFHGSYAHNEMNYNNYNNYEDNFSTTSTGGGSRIPTIITRQPIQNHLDHESAAALISPRISNSTKPYSGDRSVSTINTLTTVGNNIEVVVRNPTKTIHNNYFHEEKKSATHNNHMFKSIPSLVTPQILNEILLPGNEYPPNNIVISPTEIPLPKEAFPPFSIRDRKNKIKKGKKPITDASTGGSISIPLSKIMSTLNSR